jgi:hypothetical protein
MQKDELSAKGLDAGVVVATKSGVGVVADKPYYSTLLQEWRCHVWIRGEWLSLSCEKVVPVECYVPDGMQGTVDAFLSEGGADNGY